MPEFYTVTEVAKTLKVSRQQVYELIDQELLQAHRLTPTKKGALRISKEAFDAYLAACALGPQKVAAR